MQKGKLFVNQTIHHVPGFRLYLGLLTGLCFSFVFYSFMYIIRETIRIVSFPPDYPLWVLTDDEVWFYNLIFAYIALIMGQSLCFIIWFDSPRRMFDRRSFLRKKIVNDQRVYNLYFIFWFTKLALFFGLLFGHLFVGGFYVFSFYPDYNYVFIMIVIVLFLQSWNSVNHFFREGSLKRMIFSIILISLLAFSFSKINLYDYNRINKILLEKDVLHNYSVNLHESDIYVKKNWD
jgi:hypothetical protein